eukprot:830869-Pleurochrysis_carterae.AAC.3
MFLHASRFHPSSRPQINGVEDRLHLCLPWELPSSLRATLVLANMLPGPLISVACEIALRCATGGRAALTGFRAQDVGAVRRAFEPYFAFPPEPTLSSGGWLCFVCKRNDVDISSRDQSDMAVE